MVRRWPSLLAAALAGGPCCCRWAMVRPLPAPRCLVGCLQACFLLFAGGVQAFCCVSCPLWVASGVLLALGAVPRGRCSRCGWWASVLGVSSWPLRLGRWCSGRFPGWFPWRCLGAVFGAVFGVVFWIGRLAENPRVSGVFVSGFGSCRAVFFAVDFVRPWPVLLSAVGPRPWCGRRLLCLGVGCELVAVVPAAAAACPRPWWARGRSLPLPRCACRAMACPLPRCWACRWPLLWWAGCVALGRRWPGRVVIGCLWG